MDPQAELLQFIGQELVAHAATFLGIVAAAVTFVAGYGSRRHGRGRTIICGFLTFLLFSGAAYAGFRMLYYGQLVKSTINLDPPKKATLSQYFSDVRDNASGEIEKHWTNQPPTSLARLLVCIGWFANSFLDWRVWFICGVFGAVITFCAFYVFGMSPLGRLFCRIRNALKDC